MNVLAGLRSTSTSDIRLILAKKVSVSSFISSSIIGTRTVWFKLSSSNVSVVSVGEKSEKSGEKKIIAAIS